MDDLKPKDSRGSITETKAMTVGRLVHQKVNDACNKGVDSDVTKAMVKIMSQRSIDKRVEALMACMNELDKAQKAVRKAEKPDQKNFAADGGGVATLSYSNEAFKSLQDARDKVERIDKVIDAAILKADYSKAFEIQQKQGNK